MKKLIVILFCVLSMTQIVSAQWTTSGTNIYNSNTGNVGIGTTSPGSKLDLQGLNVTLGIYKSKFTGTESVSKGRLEIKADNADAGLYALTSLDRFGTTSEDLLFTLQQPTGNTTSWNIMESWRGAGLLISSSGPDLNPLVFGIDRVEKARLTSSGYLGIGYTSPSYQLDVNGTVRASTYLTVSDARLKTDIRQVENPLEKLNHLNGYYFRYNSEKFKERNFPKGERLGFMAQNVSEVFPQLVSKDMEGYMTVDYVSIVPLLVEAIKELDSKIATIKENYLSNLPDEKSTLYKEAYISQNFPNPSRDKGSIEYFVPDAVTSASIVVHDFNGRQIRFIEVPKRGKGVVELSTNDIQSGMYFYSLVLDGSNAMTKRLIVIK